MDETTNPNNNQQMLTATFTGEDGGEGYKNGEIYDLKKWEENDMIFISREDGSGQVAYDSMESLQNNWKIVEQPTEQEVPTAQ